MKLATNIHHVSGHCRKGFQGQRSKVKVIARSSKSSAWCRVSLLSGEVSVKLPTNVRRVSGSCCKGFQGQGSKIKVAARWNALFRRPPVVQTGRHTFRRYYIEYHLSTFTCAKLRLPTFQFETFTLTRIREDTTFILTHITLQPYAGVRPPRLLGMGPAYYELPTCTYMGWQYGSDMCYCHIDKLRRYIDTLLLLLLLLLPIR